MGIMVNLFDLNFGVSGNKLLTEKPHCDGELSYMFFHQTFFFSQLPFCGMVWMDLNSGINS